MVIFPSPQDTSRTKGPHRRPPEISEFLGDAEALTEHDGILDVY